MSIASLYPFKVSLKSHTEARPRFSLTSDILSFRRCSKQYGAFGNDGFVAARATQAFFGSAVHQVLDLCHKHFAESGGNLPTDSDIEGYFTEVQNALRSHGIRAASHSVASLACDVLKRFNKLEGPDLYPRVKDTEFRIETERPNYLLRGVVDVLATDPNDAQNPAKMEIWDYKGSRAPKLSDPRLKEYKWQMTVYAELFRKKHGVYPKQAVLYFLNELAPGAQPMKRPLRATQTLHFTPQDVQQALQEFDKTADEIISCQTLRLWPDPATSPGEETCDICDLRWNCKSPSPPYKSRLPIIT